MMSMGVRPPSVLTAVVVASSTLLVGIGAAVAGGTRHACTHAPPPLSGRPVDGSPRAGFCATVDHVWFFALLVLVAVGIVAWTARISRRSTVVALVASVLAGALAVPLFLALELEANLPNPIPL